MACVRRLSMRVAVSLCFVLLLMVAGIVLAGCQPIQAPEVAAAVPDQASSVPASELADEDVPTDTETAQVTDTVSSHVTQTVSVSATAAITTSKILTEAAVGSAADPVTNTVTSDSDLVAAGLVVYRAQYCGVCHKLDAAGTRGDFGPPHNDMGVTAAARIVGQDYRGNATTAHDYIIESVVDPLAYIVPGYAMSSHRMPIYAHLTDEELEALAVFLLAQ